jgi:hypothetical protein
MSTEWPWKLAYSKILRSPSVTDCNILYRILGSHSGSCEFFAIFSYIAPCIPYVNRRFGGKYHLHIHVENQPKTSHLLQAGFLVRLIFDLKMEGIHSSETSVHIWTTRRYIPEGGNSHRNILFFLLRTKDFTAVNINGSAVCKMTTSTPSGGY